MDHAGTSAVSLIVPRITRLSKDMSTGSRSEQVWMTSARRPMMTLCSEFVCLA